MVMNIPGAALTGEDYEGAAVPGWAVGEAGPA